MSAGPGDRLRRWWPAVPFLAVVLWSVTETQPDFDRLRHLLEGLVEVGRAALPPAGAEFDDAVEGMLETLRIAVIGTGGAVALACLVAPLASGRVAPPGLRTAVRTVLTAVRSVPLILIAVFFVAASQPGAMPGILAIWVHSTAILARQFAETLDAAETAPLDALAGSGAGALARWRFALWPQVGPGMVRDSVARFEMNLREALVLGLVGAGGVGARIVAHVRAGDFDRAMACMLVVVAVVLVIDAASGRVRAAMR